MARDDDEESGSSGAKTSRAMALVGHAASGGHHAPALNQKATSKVNQRQWDNNDGWRGVEVTTGYHEYPKHVYPWPDDPKRFVEVRNEAEEAEAMAQGKVVRTEDERKRLIAIAKVGGLTTFDGRWSIDRMVTELKNAGLDPTADPHK